MVNNKVSRIGAQHQGYVRSMTPPNRKPMKLDHDNEIDQYLTNTPEAVQNYRNKLLVLRRNLSDESVKQELSNELKSELKQCDVIVKDFKGDMNSYKKMPVPEKINYAKKLIDEKQNENKIKYGRNKPKTPTPEITYEKGFRPKAPHIRPINSPAYIPNNR